MNKDLYESITETFKDANLTENFDLKKLFGGLDPENDDIGDLRNWAYGKGVSFDQFDKAYRNWRIVAWLGDYPRDTDHYIRLFADTYRITVSFNGTFTAERLDYEPDAGNVERDLRRIAGKLKLPRAIAESKRISDSFSAFISERKGAAIREVIGNIIVPPVSAESDWEALAKAIVDTEQVSVGYAVAALKTTIWQVKRKLMNDKAFPVSDHLMVILTGPQGAGKSSMARDYFFKPLGDLMYDGNFVQIADNNNFGLWHFPMVFCDEMEKAERSDVETVKNAITSPVRSGRTLYSNNVSTRRNCCTFFGATNGTLGDKINDTTGLRRFAPIPTKYAPKDDNIAAGLPVVDWDAIGKVDYLALWQSVDWQAGHPLQTDAEAVAEWRKLIEGERAQDSVEIWLRQFEREVGETATSWKGKDLYPRYKEFCAERGYKAVADNTLGRRMKANERLPWFPFEPARVLNGTARWHLKDVEGEDADLITYKPRRDITELVAKAPGRFVDRKTGL